MDSLEKIWKDVITKTKQELISNNKIDEKQFSAYFETSALTSLEDNKATVIVPNEFTTMVMTQPVYLNVLKKNLHETTDSEYYIYIISQDTQTKEEKIKKEVIPEFKNNLITEFTFETFVVGTSNKIANAAALQVSINPGKRENNPLFIFGNSGLGKTHLLNAIGNKYLTINPSAKIYYTTINGYMNEYVEGLNRGKMNEFDEKYNSLDLLLIDDIQFLEGKDKTAEEFFHLFNNLVNNNKQIVITCDRLPQDLTSIPQRLISRFSSGLSIGIDEPEFETSYAILKKKIQLQNIDENLIDEEVIVYMAQHYGKDIRDLEGKLRRIMFDAVLLNAERIDLKFVLENSFKDDPVKHPTEKVTADLIIKVVSKYYNLTQAQVIGNNRTNQVALARSIAMYLVKQEINLTYQEIGKIFGGKNHGTVIKACQKVEKKMKEDENYSIALEEIRAKFK